MIKICLIFIHDFFFVFSYWSWDLLRDRKRKKEADFMNEKQLFKLACFSRIFVLSRETKLVILWIKKNPTSREFLLIFFFKTWNFFIQKRSIHTNIYKSVMSYKIYTRMQLLDRYIWHLNKLFMENWNRALPKTNLSVNFCLTFPEFSCHVHMNSLMKQLELNFAYILGF